MLGLAALRPRYTPTGPLKLILTCFDASCKIKGSCPVVSLRRNVDFIAVDLVGCFVAWAGVQLIVTPGTIQRERRTLGSGRLVSVMSIVSFVKMREGGKVPVLSKSPLQEHQVHCLKMMFPILTINETGWTMWARLMVAVWTMQTTLLMVEWMKLLVAEWTGRTTLQVAAFRSSELDKIGKPDTVRTLLEKKNGTTYRGWGGR